MANSAPLLEAQLADLTRDHDLLKQKYDELRVVGELARISQDVKTNSDAMRFRIIEPPAVPVVPSGPKRVLFLLAVLCASIGGGLGIAFLLSQMDDVFATPQRLREAFDIPVVGSVCWIPSKADKVKRFFDAMSVSAGAGAILVFCGLLIALTTIDLTFLRRPDPRSLRGGTLKCLAHGHEKSNLVHLAKRIENIDERAEESHSLPRHLQGLQCCGITLPLRWRHSQTLCRRATLHTSTLRACKRLEWSRH